MNRRSEIVLIGPKSAGKSTLGNLISKKLNLQKVSLDAKRWRYYEEIGYDKEKARAIGNEMGFRGVYHYWKKFDLHAVGRLFQEHQNCVFDLGAGHSVYEEKAMFAKAVNLFGVFDNVVLVLPSPDPQESIAQLHQRTRSLPGKGFDIHAHFVNHPSNEKLANYVVYTKGKRPKQTRDEILECVLPEQFPPRKGGLIRRIAALFGFSPN